MTPNGTADPEYPSDPKSAGMREDERNLINEWLKMKEGKVERGRERDEKTDTKTKPKTHKDSVDIENKE